MTPSPCSNPPTTYCPPSFDVLEHFAHTVCQEFGAEFADPEVVRGFTDFIGTVARICANNLNRKHGLESDRQVE
jgi:hypothetical protein